MYSCKKYEAIYYKTSQIPLSVREHNDVWFSEIFRLHFPSSCRLVGQIAGWSARRLQPEHHPTASAASGAPAWSGCVTRAGQTRSTSTTANTTCDKAPGGSPPTTLSQSGALRPHLIPRSITPEEKAAAVQENVFLCRHFFTLSSHFILHIRS